MQIQISGAEMFQIRLPDNAAMHHEEVCQNPTVSACRTKAVLLS